MKRLEKICKELKEKLNKEYGEYGNIICCIENNNHVKVVFEENDYLYYYLNCSIDYESQYKISTFINNILEKYDTYYELENSCIMTIF